MSVMTHLKYLPGYLGFLASTGDGAFAISLWGGGGGGGASTGSLLLTNNPPTITSTPVTTGTQGVAYDYQVIASDVDVGDTLSYALITPPTGMTIDAGTGLISWTPSSVQLGDNAVTVEVTDNGNAPAPVGHPGLHGYRGRCKQSPRSQ